MNKFRNTPTSKTGKKIRTPELSFSGKDRENMKKAYEKFKVPRRKFINYAQKKEEANLTSKA